MRFVTTFALPKVGKGNRGFRFIIIVGVAVLCTGIFLASYQSITKVSPVTAQYHYKPKIILDAGHGGFDGGAVGHDGVIEKNINLSITLVLQDMLTLSGYEVILTRDTDTATHDTGIKGIKAQKVSDIHNRLALMQAHPDAVVISIHQNKFEEARYSGLQVFYGTKTPKLSAHFAQIIQDSAVAHLQPDNTREIKKGYKTLYLLQQASQPIVLVECGFLSNPEEAALLQTEEYQKKIAAILLAATIEFVGQL